MPPSELHRQRSSQRPDQGGADDHAVVDAEHGRAHLVGHGLLEDTGRGRLDAHRCSPSEDERHQRPAHRGRRDHQHQPEGEQRRARGTSTVRGRHRVRRSRGAPSAANPKTPTASPYPAASEDHRSNGHRQQGDRHQRDHQVDHGHHADRLPGCRSAAQHGVRRGLVGPVHRRRPASASPPAAPAAARRESSTTGIHGSRPRVAGCSISPPSDAPTTKAATSMVTQQVGGRAASLAGDAGHRRDQGRVRRCRDRHGQRAADRRRARPLRRARPRLRRGRSPRAPPTSRARSGRGASSRPACPPPTRARRRAASGRRRPGRGAAGRRCARPPSPAAAATAATARATRPRARRGPAAVLPSRRAHLSVAPQHRRQRGEAVEAHASSSSWCRRPRTATGPRRPPSGTAAGATIRSS